MKLYNSTPHSGSGGARVPTSIIFFWQEFNFCISTCRLLTRKVSKNVSCLWMPPDSSSSLLGTDQKYWEKSISPLFTFQQGFFCVTFQSIWSTGWPHVRLSCLPAASPPTESKQTACDQFRHRVSCARPTPDYNLSYSCLVCRAKTSLVTMLSAYKQSWSYSNF